MMQLVVPAAGRGLRLGSSAPKALVSLAGKPMLVHTLLRFSGLGLASPVLVAAPPGSEDEFRSALAAHGLAEMAHVIAGGAERQDSVRIALEALSPETELVLIHDAARPFVPGEAIRASIRAAKTHGAATVAIRAVDTILEAEDGDFLRSTPDRAHLWACQTPQTFRVEVIRDAHRRAIERGLSATDDATLVRVCGGRVKLIEGSPENFKVTTPYDLRLAEWMLREDAL